MCLWLGDKEKGPNPDPIAIIIPNFLATVFSTQQSGGHRLQFRIVPNLHNMCVSWFVWVFVGQESSAAFCQGKSEHLCPLHLGVAKENTAQALGGELYSHREAERGQLQWVLCFQPSGSQVPSGAATKDPFPPHPQQGTDTAVGLARCQKRHCFSRT